VRIGPVGRPVRMLHLRDADHDGARIGSWRPSLSALTALLDTGREHEVAIGPLRDSCSLRQIPARASR
jgi:hypothetical protein